MPFKIRFKLVAFMGDTEEYPCHFGYKIGDEIIYDGEQFIGRVCPSLIAQMASVIKMIHDLGNKGCERSLLRYGGHSKIDPLMKQYDGVGYAPVKQGPSIGSMSSQQKGGWPIVCNDSRTSALFIAEAFDLASGGFDTPYYMREMSILEKIKNEPGIKTDMIINRFTDWERDEIFPPLTPVVMDLMLDELAETGYIKIVQGKTYPQERESLPELFVP
jgi:uncharacterized repeat protein (TIGR04076 family)